MTFTGAGHVNLVGGNVKADINNQMTGDTLVINGSTIAADGEEVAGDVANTGHMVMTNNTSVAGAITNDGNFEIENGTFTISAGGIKDTGANADNGVLTIGDGNITTTVDASTNNASIVQKTLNILKILLPLTM